MNVSATTASTLSATWLQLLLGTTGTAQTTASSGSDSASTDQLTLSAAGQQASAQGGDPFRTDLDSLESALSAGDLTTARKLYASMVDKMAQHGDVPDDFKAIGTALDSGDLSGAQTAVAKVEQNLASAPPPPPQGSNPLEQDMDQLGSLIQSGDLTGAQTLFQQILAKLQGQGASSAGATASGSSATSSSSSASAASSSSSEDALTKAISSLSSALASGDSTGALSAWQTLVAQFQSGLGGSALVKRMDALAAAAYQGQS